MAQPQWRLVANLGDVNPLDHGGCFVYRDRTGVYPPECETIEPLHDGGWEVRRFVLEPCTFQGGILSDNPYHPEQPAWFADSADRIASYVGQEFHSFVADICSDDPVRRAFAWKAIGDYHGFDNLDGYPETYRRRSDLPRRLRRPGRGEPRPVPAGWDSISAD